VFGAASVRETRKYSLGSVNTSVFTWRMHSGAPRNRTTMNQDQRIFLIGPMGAGKSSIGRKLAAALGLRFLDSDSEIESRTGVDIPLIFDIEGEEGFRRRERQAIEELSANDALVLATGGGAILSDKTRRMLRDRGLVVYLETSVDEQLRRTRRDRRRPLLQTENPRDRLQALMDERGPLYRDTAHITVNTDKRAIMDVVRQIIRALEDRNRNS